MKHNNAGIISALLLAGMVLSSCANTADTVSVSDPADETTTIQTVSTKHSTTMATITNELKV